MKTFKIFSLLIIVVFASCNNTGEKRIDQNEIQQKLLKAKNKGILFGHQDDLAYGMNWKYIEGESDVKRLLGDYPSIFGWELGGIERADEYNLDKVPFTYMQKLSVFADSIGGINTFSWHPYSPINGESSWTRNVEIVKHIIPGGSHHKEFKMQLRRVANFLKSLKDSEGKQIPFIFRPWHEMDGSWFWWGSKSCSSDDFKILFKFTINYLRDVEGVENMLVAYSPDNNFNTLGEYYTWYPGDDYVDILGMDNYGDMKTVGGEKRAIEKLHIVINAAKEKNKISAFTETGLSNVTDSTWFSKKLATVLNDSLIYKEISYVMVWRSDPNVHFFFPYEGHSAELDVVKFREDTNILLLEDFKNIN